MNKKLNRIKISIITVCFNSVSTIEQTIRSVINQSYDNIEYIIIDGGSTDGTMDIIRKYEQYISYWVSEPDDGTYAAMNKGIAKATGDVIGFMNSDDWYMDDAIHAIAEAFSRTDADIVYGKTIDVENGTHRVQDIPLLENIFSGMVFCHQSVFVKTGLMKDNPFDISYRIVADYVFFLDMYLKGKRFCQIDSTISFYRVGGISYHPWKRYIENKKAALRVSRGRVTPEHYIRIQKDFKMRRTFPVFHFLCEKIEGMPKEKKDILFTFLRDKAIVLYGAGKLGTMVLNNIKARELSVKCFWVSEVVRENNKIDGVPVLQVMPNNKQKGDIIILITTAKYQAEIVENLRSLGYCRGRDFFCVDDWLGWMGKAWMSSISNLDKEVLLDKNLQDNL